MRNNRYYLIGMPFCTSVQSGNLLLHEKSRCGNFLHLLSYNQILIIHLVEGTVEITASQKPAHVVLIQIYHTYITLVIFIILIITTGITTAHFYNFAFLSVCKFPLQSTNDYADSASFLLHFSSVLIKCLIHLTVDEFDLALDLLLQSMDRIICNLLLQLIHAENTCPKFII